MSKEEEPTNKEVEQKARRENLRYRRWGWLSWLGRLLNFGTIVRGGSLGWPEERGEAPMAELERLAKFGLQSEQDLTRLQLEDARRVMLLCSAITAIDSEASESKSALALEWAYKHGPLEISENQREELAMALKSGVDSPLQLRNEAFLLHNNVSAASRVGIVELLFRLALGGSSESKAVIKVEDIAQRLDLKANEIRLALVAARKTLNSGGATVGPKAEAISKD